MTPVLRCFIFGLAASSNRFGTPPLLSEQTERASGTASSLAVLLFMLIRRNVKQHGWTGLLLQWYTLIGEGLLIGVGAFVLIWACQLLAAPYGLYTEIEARNRTIIQQSDKRLRDRASSSQAKNSSFPSLLLVGVLRQCRTRPMLLLRMRLFRRSSARMEINRTLSTGVSLQAMKLLTPEPMKITPLVLETNSENIDIKTSKWLVLTNKTVTPVSMIRRMRQIPSRRVG